MLDYLIIRFKRHGSALELPYGAPSVPGFLLELMHVFQRECVYDVLDSRDIMPFMVELIEYARGLASRKML